MYFLSFKKKKKCIELDLDREKCFTIWILAQLPVHIRLETNAVHVRSPGQVC